MASNEQRRRDSWSKAAKDSGYRSRAAYKLLELDRRCRLLKPGQRVLDLGAAPGSWSQVAAQKIGNQSGNSAHRGLVLAIDLKPVQPLPGVRFLCADALDPDTLPVLRQHLGAAGADLVLSDMAPNLSGIAARDQQQAAQLALGAADLARQLLVPGGTFVCKLFQGAEFAEVLRQLRGGFDKIKCYGLKATRRASSETFCVARLALDP